MNPLDDLDVSFLKAYKARTAMVQAASPPYIEVLGSSLVLHLHGQEPVKAQVLTAPYHRLKDVAHVPFTIYLLLKGSARITDDQLSALRDLQTRLAAAESDLPSEEFGSTQLARQRKILDGSTQLVSAVIASRTVDADALSHYTQSMAPLMLQNADEAGCLQVQTTHKQVLAWEPRMTERDWKDLRVINKSSHQPRYRNVATQYFGWLLGGSSPSWAYPGETSRVIYVETLFQNQADEEVLLDVMVDFEASRDFFGEEWRMTEDVLSDGAARCIKNLPAADRDWKRANGTAQ